MANVTLTLGLALVLAAGRAAPETAADAITLSDGKVVLGQVVEPAPRGMMVLLVRRAWAEANLPDWARRWEAAEAPTVRKALAQRKERLTAWRRQREGTAKQDDPVLAWIDRELARLADPAEPSRSTLMVVMLNRGGVKSMVRRPKASVRMLRQGWLSGFANVETLPLDSLKDALEDRGFAADGQGPVSVDRLLPIIPESDAQWLTRRAATEVSNDPGLKFLRTQGAVLPEPVPGQPLPGGALGSVLGEVKRLLDDNPSDPMTDRFREVAAKGRIGVVVTRLDISPDLSAVRVESTLLVRMGGDRWTPSGSRTATVRPSDLPQDAGKEIAEDPQVKAVFNLVDAIGLVEIPEDVKRRSLNVGAATQKALGQVRSAFLEDLSSLAFPVNDVAAEGAKPEKQP